MREREHEHSKHGQKERHFMAGKRFYMGQCQTTNKEKLCLFGQKKAYALFVCLFVYFHFYALLWTAYVTSFLSWYFGCLENPSLVYGMQKAGWKKSFEGYSQVGLCCHQVDVYFELVSSVFIWLTTVPTFLAGSYWAKTTDKLRVLFLFKKQNLHFNTIHHSSWA